MAKSSDEANSGRDRVAKLAKLNAAIALGIADADAGRVMDIKEFGKELLARAQTYKVHAAE